MLQASHHSSYQRAYVEHVDRTRHDFGISFYKQKLDYSYLKYSTDLDLELRF